MQIVDKHKPREYSAFAHSSGVVLCDKTDGAFLVLRFAEDLERLRALLETITTLPSSPDVPESGFGNMAGGD